ncbi:MAG: hypothetical protein ACWGNI_00180 [Desulfobacterales bacterium]
MNLDLSSFAIFAAILISANIIARAIKDSIEELKNVIHHKLDDIQLILSREDYYGDEEPEEEIKEEENVSHMLGVASASNCEPQKIHFKEEESK